MKMKSVIKQLRAIMKCSYEPMTACILRIASEFDAVKLSLPFYNH
jgi:hypothetical protein